MNAKCLIKLVNFCCALALITFVACSSDKTTENTETEKQAEIVATGTGNTESNAQSTSSESAADTNGEGEEANGEFAKMSFVENSYDFGSIQEGKVVEHTFEFTNTGTVPLVIKDATASCGCTVPQWPKEPVAPGAKSKIQVQFNSNGKAGNINKTVTIQANTYPPITTLQITGTVTQVLDTKGPLNNK